MKTIIIIIVIVSVLYCIANRPDDPRPHRQVRNRSEEDRKNLTDWLALLDELSQPEADELKRKISTSLKFGWTAKELSEIRAEMKSLYR